MNCLRSVPAFAGCFLELNDVYWVLLSTNVFFNVSCFLYDESEFTVASLSPLRRQSFLSLLCFLLGFAVAQHYANLGLLLEN